MKAKYERGKQIRNMCDFEKSKSLWYKVRFGNSERTRHRGFLISWQYHTLDMFIRAGRVYEAKPIRKEGENDPNCNRSGQMRRIDETSP